MKKLMRYWYALTHIGVDTEMPYIELKRVEMVNLIALTCLPFMSLYAVLNFSEGRYMLSSINLANALFSVAVLVLQFYRQHTVAKVVLLASCFLFFFLGGLIYRNAGEYFLICILVVTMLLYDSSRIQWSVGSLVVIGILLIQAFPDIGFPEEPIPKGRVLSNIASSLVFIVVAVNFFKNIIYDNTKQIEEQRIRLQAMNRDKEKIFSIVAHDLRGPLTTVESMVNVLREQLLSGEISEEFIMQLKNSISHQNKVLEGLLQWSSSSMQGIQKSSTAVYVMPIVNDIIQGFTAQYLQKRLTFDVRINPELTVYADSNHLIIILRNLISNAIKFSHRNGDIEIYSSEEKERAYVHIRDHGIGMPESKSNLLFDTIQQRSFGTDNEPGAGLGLVLCKELIKLNGGSIHIESMSGKGSVFTIGLPMTAAM